MIDTGYVIIFIILFLIIIGLIVALIYCDSKFNDQTEEVNSLKQQLENCQQNVDPGISLPVPIEAFKNQFGSNLQVTDKLFLTYDSSARTVLTTNTMNQVSLQPILLTINNQGASNDQQWTLEFTSSNTVKIGNYNRTLFWTIPNAYSSGDLITLTSNGSNFVIDSMISYLNFTDSDDKFILTANNNPTVALSLIEETSISQEVLPVTLYVFGY